MTIEWLAEDWLNEPIVQVDDNGTIWSAYNEGLTLQQVANDYGDQSENETTRTVMVRQADETGGFTAWAGPFTIPYVAPPPLTTLAWNGGNPTAGPIPRAHVVDDGGSVNALSPDEWSLQQIADDYANGYVEGTEVYICENRSPHSITVRLVSENGNTAFESFAITPNP